MKYADLTHSNNVYKTVKWWGNIIFFYIIFLQCYFRNFIQFRKTWALFLHLNSRILPICMISYLKICMTNFTLNLVKKNNVKLPQKYGNFTRSEFYGISASLVLASATSKISVHRIPCKFIYFYYIVYYSCFEFLSYELYIMISGTNFTQIHSYNLEFSRQYWNLHLKKI